MRRPRGALVALVSKLEEGGETMVERGGVTVLGVASEHGLDAHADALDALDGAPAVAVG